MKTPIENLVNIFWRELASEIFKASYSPQITGLFWKLQLDIIKFDGFIRKHLWYNNDDISLSDIIKIHFPDNEEEIKELIFCD